MDDPTNAEQFWLSWSWSGPDTVPSVMCTSPTSAQRKDSASDIPSPVPSRVAPMDSSDTPGMSPPQDVDSKKERRRAQNRVA